MALDRVMMLQVADEGGYTEYRRRMTPLLEAHGGRFVLDVRLSEVLLAPEPGAWNRLFVIRFPDADAHDRFFADPDYGAVRAGCFEASVAGTLQIGRYEIDD